MRDNGCEKQGAEQWLGWKTREMVAGKPVPAAPSGKSHCAVTEVNMAARELEVEQG